MATYILHRLLLSIPVLFLVTVGAFALVRVVPGDIATLKLGQNATQEDIDAFRQSLGLDRPIVVQYVDWLAGLARGDMGKSLWESRPVTTVIMEKFPVTLELALLTVLISTVVAVPLGVLSAVNQDGVLDQVVRFLAILLLAIPSFWLAILLVTLPSIWWGWKPPTSGYTNLWEDPLANLGHMIWPALVTASASAALVLRLTRSSLLEVLRQDYIRTARAKGLRERVVIARHALRNGLIPVVTVIGLQLSVLLGGAVIAEQVFSIPGMGRSMLQAVFRRDYPLIQGYVLVFATLYIVVNLVVDVLYSYLDPRIRYS